MRVRPLVLQAVVVIALGLPGTFPRPVEGTASTVDDVLTVRTAAAGAADCQTCFICQMAFECPDEATQNDLCGSLCERPWSCGDCPTGVMWCPSEYTSGWACWGG